MTQVAHRPKHPKTRAERRRAERKKAHRKPRRSWFPIAIVAAGIVAAGVIAVLTTAGSSKPSKGLHEIAKVSLSGTALPIPASPDRAVGMRAPLLNGISFNGSPVTIPVAGKPTVVIFLAHWCPHCDKDVPEIQGWLDRNGMPSDIAIQTVSTWVDASRPNYPPSTWLHDAGWTPQVLVDDTSTVVSGGKTIQNTNSAAYAYGLENTPMLVFVGADGTVKFRMVGEISPTQFAAALDRLRAA